MRNLELKKTVASILDEYVDIVLVKAKFARRKGSLQYGRKTSDLRQKLIFHVRSPRYSDDESIAHVSATVAFYLSEISEVLESLLGGDLENYPGNDPLTMGFNSGFVGPTGEFETWRPKSLEDIPQLGREISQYVSEYVLPFFDKYKSLSNLANAYTDAMFSNDEGTLLQLAATNLSTGNPLACKKIIEDGFGRNNRLRKRYSAAIEVANSLGE